jgi:hypothetical protein
MYEACSLRGGLKPAALPNKLKLKLKLKPKPKPSLRYPGAAPTAQIARIHPTLSSKGALPIESITKL